MRPPVRTPASTSSAPNIGPSPPSGRRAGPPPRGPRVAGAPAGSAAGIDVVSSEYATVAAEQTALERLSREIADQIVSRVALYAARTGGSGARRGRSGST